MNIRLFKIVFWFSTAVLVAASLVPVDLLPRQTATVWDKAQHAMGFAWLSWVGLLCYRQRAGRLVIGLLLLGGAIELLQAASGWRFGEWQDLLADAIGIAVGTLLGLCVQRRTVTPVDS